MDKYDKQAADWLRATGSTLTVTFLRTGKYFPSDTVERDIYQFTLANTNGGYSATFGQSVNATMNATTPRRYDILSCLDANDPGTFEEFCAEYGYNDQPLSTYPEAKRTYDTVKAQVDGLRAMYTDEELDQLAEIQ
jgi:hypothetical protein